MPVPKVTADQFAIQLNQSIQERNRGHDTEVGPIPDIIVQPEALVLERQNDRIRQVSQLILLDEQGTFEDADVEAFVFNEFLVRNLGGRSSATVVFSRVTAPQIDITVQKNFPIATVPDESTGETVVFVTTEEKTLPVATAASFFNLETERYELEVAVQATITGRVGEVGPGKINRPLRPLSGFDSVENRSRSSVVSDRETNLELLERYNISIIGSQLGTQNGLRLFIKSQFQDAGDVLVVNAGDPLITRESEDSGAIDVFITGEQNLTRQDEREFLGIGQLIPLVNQPVQSIVNVPGFVLDTDYIFVKDTTGVSNSVRAQDGIKFLATGSVPAIGSSINVEYQQDILVANIQSALDSADTNVGGQDPLIRSGDQVDTTLAAQLVVLPGFGFTTIQNTVITAIVEYINLLGLGEDVEKSDIQAVVRGISGVDNFIFSVLDRVGGTANEDILIEKSEFARIETGNISLTP
jgi:uncharacterized phage protein gp47/JayE